MKLSCSAAISTGLVRAEGQQFVGVQHAENQRQHRHDAGHQQQVVAETSFQVGQGGRRQQAAQDAVPLGGKVGSRLA